MTRIFLYCFDGFLSDCEDLVAPLHGYLSSNAVSHGNYVKVSCQQGYFLSGDQTLMCSSGYLSATIGTCDRSKYSKLAFLFYVTINILFNLSFFF